MTAALNAAGRRGNWAWRRRVALSILFFCGISVLASLLPAVSDPKAGTLITCAFTLAGAVFSTYVVGAVTHDAIKPKEG